MLALQCILPEYFVSWRLKIARTLQDARSVMCFNVKKTQTLKPSQQDCSVQISAIQNTVVAFDFLKTLTRL